MDALLQQTYVAEQRHFWYRGFREFIAPLVAAAARCSTSPRLLDAGCGTGANLAFLRTFGKPVGLELSESGLTFARQQARGPLVRGSVTHLPFSDESVDVVLSFDVLYCLEPVAERSAIQEMYRVLRPGGSLVLNVAAMPMLRGDHSVLGGEVHRYTRGELKAALQRAGFAVDRLTYTNASIFPLMALVRAYQRMRGLKAVDATTGDFHVPPAAINALLAVLLALEARIVHLGFDMPFGSSLLCRATKATERSA